VAWFLAVGWVGPFFDGLPVRVACQIPGSGSVSTRLDVGPHGMKFAMMSRTEQTHLF